MQKTIATTEQTIKSNANKQIINNPNSIKASSADFISSLSILF